MILKMNRSDIKEIIQVGLHTDTSVHDSPVKGYFDIYSPRVSASVEDKDLDDNHTYLYWCAPNTFDDVYRFMLACKAKRSNINYYIFNGDPDEIKRIDPTEHEEYNIVSGNKIPDNIRSDKRDLIIKYMLEGVHLFMVMVNRGVGDFTERANGAGSYSYQSHKPHSYQRGDDWALNTSNVFMGMIIDYYRIESGVPGLDAQISFMRNEQYRIAVFIHVRDVFRAFVANNVGHMNLTDKDLAKQVVNILMS